MLLLFLDKVITELPSEWIGKDLYYCYCLDAKSCSTVQSHRLSYFLLIDDSLSYFRTLQVEIYSIRVYFKIIVNRKQQMFAYWEFEIT